MQVSTQQFDRLSASAQHSFQQQLAAHCQVFAPLHCAALSAQELDAAIERLCARANSHGLEWRAPMRCYVELGFMFGSSFDTDPTLPWAAAILADPEAPFQLQKADRLHAAARHFAARVGGPGGRWMRDALVALSNERDQPAPPGDQHFGARMLQRLSSIYPARTQEAGETALRQLMQHAEQQARQHGLYTNEGVAVLSALMLALGHGCCDDPLYPWVSRTLARTSAPSPESRAAALRARSLAYLDKVLAGMAAHS